MVTSSAPNADAVLNGLEASDRLLIQQVFKPIANEYRISVAASGESEEGRPLLYVKQKKMKIKEDIRFRLTPDDDQHLFMIKSKSAFEFRGRHEVLDADGAVIGMLEKDFRKSLLRSHWHVRDAAGEELLEAHEASWIIALLRRFAQLGPDWFDLLAWLPFNFVLRRGGHQVGAYKRVLGKFRDRYVLELEPQLKDMDRRLIVAFAIGLDALQDRKSPLREQRIRRFPAATQSAMTAATNNIWGSRLFRSAGAQPSPRPHRVELEARASSRDGRTNAKSCEPEGPQDLTGRLFHMRQIA